VQSVPAAHALIVLDIRNGAKPVEVSRLKISETFKPHWTGWDAKTQRLVVTGREPRLFLAKLDPATGVLAMDDTFHDVDGKPGFSFADREWPHGWKGSGLPHGVGRNRRFQIGLGFLDFRFAGYRDFCDSELHLCVRQNSLTSVPRVAQNL